jgi:hypothetical protein
LAICGKVARPTEGEEKTGRRRHRRGHGGADRAGAVIIESKEWAKNARPHDRVKRKSKTDA